MPIRILGAGSALLVAIAGAALWYLTSTFATPPVNPAWAAPGSANIPADALTVRFTGTSTLLFSDGETDWMVDGWFTRIGPLSLMLGRIGPDIDAIERGLERNAVEELAVVIPVHSHFDHAMDAPEVARRTGALLLGSESTANIGRGWGLDEGQIRVAVSGEPVRFGAFTIRLIETNHFEFPDPAVRERALGTPRIEAPLVPPVDTFDYRVGQPYAIHVEHPLGRFLIQGSAGYRVDSLSPYASDVVFLGIGGLGTQSLEYREAYWRETVEAVAAERVIAIHWDSLTGPIEGPFTGSVRAASFLSGGSDLTLDFLEAKLRANPSLSMTTLPRYEEVVLFPAPRP
jgi:L-ascorbate metabolism protein UlaG (beta-lactamase superfamily)